MARAKNEHRRALEERAGIGARAAQKRIKEGTDSETYQQSKERTQKATADLREHQVKLAKIKIDEEEERLISREEVTKAALSVAALFVAEGNSFRNNAPGKLAGLDEISIRKIIDAEWDALMEKLHKGLETL